MCKFGDIIVVKEGKDMFGNNVPKHPFVVINDQSNYIQGLTYDFISNMLCSFHNEEHKIKKLSYYENLEIRRLNIMNEQNKKKIGFPKDFFTNLKVSKVEPNKNEVDDDPPFEWDEDVLEGKTKVVIVPAKKK